MINFLTVSNYGYIIFVKNMIKNFISKNFLSKNILYIVCLDIETHIELEKLINNYKKIILIDDFINDNKFHDFETESFKVLSYKKTQYTINLLKNKEIVYFIDSDIHFFKDPTEYVYNNLILKNNDILYQQNKSIILEKNLYDLYVCTGNYCVKQNNNSIKYLENVYKTFDKTKTEQQHLNSYLLNTCLDKNNVTSYPYAKIDILDPYLFQNGYDAFKYDLYLNENKICVHANHVIGYDKKFELFSKMNAWIN